MIEAGADALVGGGGVKGVGMGWWEDICFSLENITSLYVNLPVRFDQQWRNYAYFNIL